MRWELRARSAERGMTTAAGVRRRLAAAGLVVSVGKMSGLWSGTPVSVRLDDLEVICGVLGCEPSDLLVRDRAVPVAPDPAPAPGLVPGSGPGAGPGPGRADGLSLPAAGRAAGAGSRADRRGPRRLVPPL
jgi:putative transcriptional regulator